MTGAADPMITMEQTAMMRPCLLPASSASHYRRSGKWQSTSAIAKKKHPQKCRIHFRCCFHFGKIKFNVERMLELRLTTNKRISISVAETTLFKEICSMQPFVFVYIDPLYIRTDVESVSTNAVFFLDLFLIDWQLFHK